MATTSTINHQDIHHQPGAVGGVVTLQLAQQMTNCTSSSADSDSAKSSLCSDATAEDLIFFHTQSNPIMDFLLEGDTGSSRESLANLLDEGLGTSLDGTEDLCSTHPSLGRNDSGVFSSDEAAGISGQQGLSNSSNSGASSSSQMNGGGSNSPEVQQQPKKLSRQKNASPNRQGPQRCVICGKTFSNASALTKHKLTHSDERKHTCSVCGKAFKRQDHLNGHMLTHRSKKPFECSAENCGKSYCDARSLRRHIESRHGVEALATMTIAPTPHSESDFSIIIPNPNSSGGSSKAATKTKRASSSSAKSPSKAKSQKVSNSNSNNANPNPLLCQGSSSSPEEAGADDNELLTSVENFLGLEDSSASNAENNAAVALLDMDMQMGVIQEEMEGEIEMDVDIPSSVDDKLNNNNNSMKRSNSEELLCCLGRGGNGDIIGGNAGADTQSQLHQLLTQRALCKSESEEVEAAAVTLIKESLIASCANNGVTPLTKPFQLQLSSATPGQSDPATGKSRALIPVTKWANGSGNNNGSEMGKSVSRVTEQTVGGIVIKCPSSPHITSPQSLKEQLELIHQIIQQTTEESATFTSGGVQGVLLSSGRNLAGGPICVNISKTPIVSSLPVKASAGSEGTTENLHVPNNKNGEEASARDSPQTVQVPTGSPAEDFGGGNLGPNPLGKGEDKPVECAICCRRFKNTPALNGHMRLHGGYFKKESDGKKKEPTTKETHGAPLQTASVSVRALIEEKIIQRRNQGSGSSNASSASNSPKTSPPTSNPTTPTKKPAQVVNPQTSSSSSVVVPLSQNQSHLSQTEPKNTTAFPNQNSSQGQCQPLTFEDAHAEYLLIEEEVFNKVSSICPDSFFSGIDETLLCESGIGTGSDSSQISTEFFNWSTTGAGQGGNDGASPLFTGPTTPSSGPSISSCSGSENPFTPLPTMDPVFFTPGSVHSHHSQHAEELADSPSFMYPTPPASLESHNALQSPLFPYQIPMCEASPCAGPIHVFPPPSSTSSSSGNGNCSKMIANYLGGNAGTPIPPNSSNGFLLTAASPSQSQVQTMVEQCASISATTSNPSISVMGATGGNQSQHCIPPELSLPPQPSPSSSNGSPSLIMTTSSLQQPLTQMKGNEPCPITGELDESDPFPKRHPTSLETLKLVKRKALRNTLASNLRPQTSQSPTHFTPYPILSPVRSASGLYWTFSGKLSHVDETKKDRPRINVGANFQAVIPPLLDAASKEAYSKEAPREDLVWSPDSVMNCYDEDVERYLAFACCSAIPGGGRNKEFALHILHMCGGDLNVAMLLLMNPEPKLPPYLLEYKYPDREKWMRNEILQFQESLLRHGKDFGQVSKEIGTKSREACVSFYQLWKKVCSEEYEKVRSVWKKREAAFTIELLKTIPPPLHPAQPSVQTQQGYGSSQDKTKKQGSKSASSAVTFTRNANGVEEFPCKICGKVFSKVKSRSAHMKSHRPPPTPPSNSPAPALSPASAATLLENKEKIADALQKHIFGKACASLAKTIQAATAPSPPPQTTVAPFMPKIVKVESLTATANLNNNNVNINQVQTPAVASSQCFQPNPTPTAHPLKLQAT